MDVSQVGQIALSVLKSRWGLGVFTALCSGYLTADIANSGVRALLVVAPGTVQVAPEYGGQSEGEAIPGAAAVRDLNVFSQRNLMGLKREDLTPPDPSEVSQENAPKELGDKFSENELRACTLTGSLQATLVASGVPAWSVAIIFDKRESESFAFSINPGNNVIEPDATLLSIESRSIVIRRKDHFERCYGEDEGSTAVAGVLPVPTEGGEEIAPAGGGVTQLSANDYAIDRPELDRVLTNLNEVATQARAVPSFKDGKANGFKMFSIKSGSIYAKIGLKNGDVIQKVNGMELNSPDRALELYQKLKTATSVNMEIQRRGQSRSLNYTIR